MSFQRATIHWVECDRCCDDSIRSEATRGVAIAKALEAGWYVNRKTHDVFCADCREEAGHPVTPPAQKGAS